MVRISPDVGKNRVIIKFSGSPGSDGALMAERELRAALERLRPPIDVLSDIRELQSLDRLLAEDFKRVSEILREFGVKKVVRVVGKSAQAAVHMQRLSRHLNGHTAHLAFSMEEAEQVFNK